MGNVAAAGELTGSDERDELFGLDAHHAGPEGDDQDDDGADDEGAGADYEGEGVHPDEMPQG